VSTKFHQKAVSAKTSGFNDFGTNTFGFNIGFKAPAPADEVENATNTKGRVRLTVASFRSISKRILPLYRKIRDNNTFAILLVLAAKNRNNALLRGLIAPLHTKGIITPNTYPFQQRQVETKDYSFSPLVIDQQKFMINI
jgi:hypothetical protein